MEAKRNRVLFTPTLKAAPAIADLNAIKDQYLDRKDLSDVASGNHIICLSEVTSHIFRIINSFIVVDQDSAVNYIYLRLDDPDNTYFIKYAPSPAAHQSVNFVGQLVMKPGDNLTAYINGASSGDTLNLAAIGYDVHIY